MNITNNPYQKIRKNISLGSKMQRQRSSERKFKAFFFFLGLKIARQ
uniref:Exocyst complex component EXO70B1 n=1 Tax=Rhizophora mucronata TaxID=61149 RepID=A0A2P2MY23_RHIMU